jgi:integrating conjugative element protein (TIGR03756 family)
MKLLSVLCLFIFLISPNTFAYKDYWKKYDGTNLTPIRDDTIGKTQSTMQGQDDKCNECHGATTEEYSGVMDSLDISKATMSAALSCLDWEVRGVCVWLTCVLLACDLDVSIKVKNFVPELTMQSYSRANGEPWSESQNVNHITKGDAGSSWVTKIISWIEGFDVKQVGIEGGTSTTGSKRLQENLDFKLVDAYGNPAIEIFNSLIAETGYACGGTTTMFFPYYISNLDSIAWRWDVPEMFYPQSLLPLLTNNDLTGGSSNNYGPVFPRHGFTVSQDPLKTAVLSIYRSAHFITRSSEPHLYFSIDEGSGQGYWPPGPLDKDDENTGKFQMLYPQAEDSCRTFPYGKNESKNMRSDDGSYIWNFWRAFKCCEREGAVLIYHSG